MYDYQKERPTLFTESGVAKMIEIRDQVHKLLDASGAFRGDKISVSGDSFFILATLDYLVELGEIVKLRPENSCWAQFQVFSTSKVVG